MDELNQALEKLKAGEITTSEYLAIASRVADEQGLGGDMPTAQQKEHKERADIGGASVKLAETRRFELMDKGLSPGEARSQAQREARDIVKPRESDPQTPTYTEAFNRAFQKRTLGTLVGKEQRRSKADLQRESERLNAEEGGVMSALGNAAVETAKLAALPIDPRDPGLRFRQLAGTFEALTGGEVTPDTEIFPQVTALAPALMETAEKEGELLQVESEVGRWLRFIGAGLGAPVFETAGRMQETAPSIRSPGARIAAGTFPLAPLVASAAGILPLPKGMKKSIVDTLGASDPILTKEQRGRTRTLPSGERSFFLDMMQGIEEGDAGFMEIAGQSAESEGFSPGGVRAAKLFGFAADIALPVERLSLAPVSLAAKGVPRAVSLASDVPKAARWEAAKLALGSSIGVSDIADIGKVVRRELGDLAATQKVMDLPPRLKADTIRLLSLGKGNESLSLLEAGVKAGHPGQTAKYLDAVSKAASARARRLLGDHELDKLTKVSIVTKSEGTRIRESVAKTLLNAGIDMRKQKVDKAGNIVLTPDQLKGLNALIKSTGIKVPVQATPQVAKEVFALVRDALLDSHAGRSAQIHTAARRMTWLDSFGEALEQLSVGAIPRDVAKASLESWLPTGLFLRRTGTGKSTFRNHIETLARNIELPQQAFDIMQNHLRRIERVGADVIATMKEAAAEAAATGSEFSPIAKLADMLGDGLPLVHIDDLPVLDLVATAVRANVKRVEDLRQLVEEVVQTSNIVGHLERAMIKPTATPGDMVVGLEQWANRLETDVQKMGKDIHKAYSPLSEPPPPSDLRALVEAFMSNPRDVARLIPGDTSLPEHALTSLAIKWTGQRRMAEAVDDLIGMSLGLPRGSPLSKVVNDIMQGKTETVINGVLTTSHSPSDMMRGQAFVERWGLRGKIGAAATGRGTEDFASLPNFVMEELRNAAKRAGVADADLVNPAGDMPGVAAAIGYVTTRQKAWMLLYAPAFYVAQVVTAPISMMETLGARGTVSALSQWGKNPGICAEIVRGLSDSKAVDVGFYFVPRKAKNAVIPIADGSGLYTVGEGIQLAKRFAIDQSQAMTETSKQLLEDIIKLDPKAALSMRGVWTSWNGFEEGLRQFAHSLEQVFRVSVFVDQLKKGLPPEAAARLSRDALYDYGKMSDFERFSVRKFFLYYSFERANTERYIASIIEDPSRAARLARFSREHRNAFFDQSEVENLGEWPENRSKLAFLRMQPGKLSDDTTDRRFANVLFMAPGGKIQPDEAVNTLITFLTLPFTAGAALGEAVGVLDNTDGPSFGESTRDVFGKGILPITVAFETASDVDPGLGGPASEQEMSKNQIPAFLMDMDVLTFGVLGDMFGAERIKTDDPNKAIDASDPRMTRWVATGSGQEFSGLWRWRLMQGMFGRFIGTLNTLDRAGVIPGSSEPRPSIGRAGELASIVATPGFEEKPGVAVERIRQTEEREILDKERASSRRQRR